MYEGADISEMALSYSAETLDIRARGRGRSVGFRPILLRLTREGGVVGHGLDDGRGRVCAPMAASAMREACAAAYREPPGRRFRPADTQSRVRVNGGGLPLGPDAVAATYEIEPRSA